MASGMTIGRLAKEVGVNIETVRYYERRKLLMPTARKPSGYRLYGEDAALRLRFIKNAHVNPYPSRTSSLSIRSAGIEYRITACLRARHSYDTFPS